MKYYSLYVTFYFEVLDFVLNLNLLQLNIWIILVVLLLKKLQGIGTKSDKISKTSEYKDIIT